MHSESVLILDFGSQYTQLIARRVREASVYCEIHPFTDALAELERLRPKGIILSGGPASVHDAGAPSVPADVFERGIPVLGICYGMQLMTHVLGGQVERSRQREYGPAQLVVDEPDELFRGFYRGETTPVWMSHGDRILEPPAGFGGIAHSAHSPVAAMSDPVKQRYGVQFHPEVVHTQQGAQMLENFLRDVCRCDCDWTPQAFAQEAVRAVRERVGDGRAICAISGGVDSSVAAALVHRAVGDRLQCVFVDNGLLRLHELEQVSSMLEPLGLNLTVVDAREAFLRQLDGVTDPEEKRRRIGHAFIEVFDREAHKFEGIDYLVQGTTYPDVIESVSVRGPSATIKTHHNVGGLPERMNLKLVEPIRELFKDEVRKVGAALGLPHRLLWRQPFPGPGLAVRVLGPVTPACLEVLREADWIVREEIERAGLNDALWQAFAVLIPVQTVGVKGDERSYEHVIALRAVESLDGMTANVARLPYELLETLGSRIPNEVPGVNRVVYDLTPKPPGTIEWE